MGTLKTYLFMAVLTALFVVIGGALGGQTGMVIALVIAAAMNFGSYWFSDKIVLRMYQAREIGPNELPWLYNMVRDLAQRAGLPMPRVYVIPQDQPNAFATGRNPQHAAVAFTEGILHLLDREELEGVAAHELAHIKNRDILIGSIAATVAGAISMIANMAQWAMIFGSSSDEEEGGGSIFSTLLMLILAPIAAMIIQMAISRSREYLADATGAKISGNPRGLANALRKLHHGVAKIPGEATPATAHMFVVNPLRGGGVMSLFSTHPDMEKRIARLEKLQIEYALTTS
ncbi:MAG: zinc metalloprotease HtpX [Calditrichaeota bacterium]|nr:zinc metalloprotease HtpX [Calditrichota bacterium]MCB0303150.1 zinc metalloprotease HtpX [Calditrichota bacterium]